jgi:hypothetical protein
MMITNDDDDDDDEDEDEDDDSYILCYVDVAYIAIRV